MVAMLFALPRAVDQAPVGTKRRYGIRLPSPEQIRCDEGIPWKKVQALASGKMHTFRAKTLAPVLWKKSGAGQAHAANRQVRTVDEAGNTVETTDADARVFTDAEGQGGQGRQLEERAEPTPDEPAANEPKGFTTDRDGQMHLDLEA